MVEEYLHGQDFEKNLTEAMAYQGRWLYSNFGKILMFRARVQSYSLTRFARQNHKLDIT
jgi:hypothetical protein